MGGGKRAARTSPQRATASTSASVARPFRSSGSILVDGDDPDENAAVRERMCFVREDQKYNDAFSVKDILRVAPAFYPSWASETADRLSERFRLPLTTKSKRLFLGLFLSDGVYWGRSRDGLRF